MGVKGEDFYEEPRDVIDRLLERRNASESRIADIYLACVGGSRTATTTSSEKGGSALNSTSPTSSTGPEKETGPTTVAKEKEVTEVTEQMSSVSEPMEIDDTMSEPVGPAQHKNDGIEANKTSAMAMVLDETPSADDCTNEQKHERTQLELSSGEQRPEKDTPSIVVGTGKKSGDINLSKDRDRAEEEGMVQPSVVLGGDAVNESSLDLVNNGSPEKDIKVQKHEASVTQTEPSKTVETALKEEETKVTLDPDKEEGEGDNKRRSSRRKNGGLSDLENDTDSKRTTNGAGNKDKVPKHEFTAKILVGKRRRRAANKVKGNIMYKEDELEEMIEAHEKVGLVDESEQQSIEGSSNNDKDKDSESESNDGNHKRKRRKRKPVATKEINVATKEVNGEEQPKKRGRGRPKRKTQEQTSPKQAKAPQPRGRKPRQPSVAMIDLSWKNGGKNFPKKISQVGPDFNATDIPETGTWDENESSK